MKAKKKPKRKHAVPGSNVQSGNEGKRMITPDASFLSRFVSTIERTNVKALVTEPNQLIAQARREEGEALINKIASLYGITVDIKKQAIAGAASDCRSIILQTSEQSKMQEGYSEEKMLRGNVLSAEVRAMKGRLIGSDKAESSKPHISARSNGKVVGNAAAKTLVRHLLGAANDGCVRVRDRSRELSEPGHSGGASEEPGHPGGKKNGKPNIKPDNHPLSPTQYGEKPEPKLKKRKRASPPPFAFYCSSLEAPPPSTRTGATGTALRIPESTDKAKQVRCRSLLSRALAAVGTGKCASISK